MTKDNAIKLLGKMLSLRGVCKERKKTRIGEMGSAPKCVEVASLPENWIVRAVL